MCESATLRKIKLSADVIQYVVSLNAVCLHAKCMLQIFKMWNKELYVREQQDAYEFFTSLVDQLDEHLKVKHMHITLIIKKTKFLFTMV